MTAPRKTLYQDLVAAGVEVSSHESDLYFPVTEASMEILSRHPLEKENSTRFLHNVTYAHWVDVPFAYDPWWEKRLGKGETK